MTSENWVRLAYTQQQQKKEKDCSETRVETYPDVNAQWPMFPPYELRTELL